jgi:hypothetical protein
VLGSWDAPMRDFKAAASMEAFARWLASVATAV